MKEIDLAEIFRTKFAADSAFTGTGCFNDLRGGEPSLPCLVFKVDTEPQNASGTALEFTLSISCESVSGVGSEVDAHKALVDAVTTKLHGTGKSALLTALNAVGTFLFYGWGVGPDSPGVAGNHFRTSVTARGSVDVL